MEKSNTGLTIYVFLTLVWELLDYIIVSNSVLSLFRLIIFAWSFLFFIETLFNKNTLPIIKALIIFYSLLAIYGIIVVVEGKTFIVGLKDSHIVVTLSYIVKVSWSLLPIFVFYQYGRKGILTRSFFQKWINVFIIAATICYYMTKKMSMIKNGTDDSTNNGGYIVLSIVPMLLFLETRSIKQYILLGYCLVLILLSMKRGAILIAIMITGIYFLFLFKNAQKTTKLGIIIALVIGLLGCFFIFDRMISNSDHFNQRIDDTLEGDTNGREFIQGFFISYYFFEASTKEQILGGGANRTLELLNMYAHCDWIELLINQGLLGVCVYILFWIRFACVLFKKNIPPIEKIVLVMIFCIYFMRTIFSMSYSEYNLFSSMAFGYSLGFMKCCDFGEEKTC